MQQSPVRRISFQLQYCYPLWYVTPSNSSNRINSYQKSRTTRRAIAFGEYTGVVCGHASYHIYACTLCSTKIDEMR